MWEETGAPPQAAIPRKKNRKKRKSEENLVLWAQILLCLAAVGFTLCARSMEWPILPRLRVAFETAMQPEQELFLAQGRNLAKFTEDVIETFNNGFAAFGAEAPQTAARTAHAKAQEIRRAHV